MRADSYAAEVAQLLTLGEVGFSAKWSDYSELGLRAEHVPELIQLATNEELMDAEEDTPAAWGPVHARRALGQLHAVEAIRPLLSLMHRLEDVDDDLLNEDFIDIVPMLGESVIGP